MSDAQRSARDGEETRGEKARRGRSQGRRRRERKRKEKTSGTTEKSRGDSGGCPVAPRLYYSGSSWDLQRDQPTS